MPEYYTCAGQMRVVATAPLTEIKEALDDVSLDELEFSWEFDPEYPGELLVSVDAHGEIHATGLCKFEDILKRLVPFVVRGVNLYTTWQDEPGTLYIGPPDQLRAANSATALAEILELIPTLTEEDAIKVHDALASPRRVK